MKKGCFKDRMETGPQVASNFRDIIFGPHSAYNVLTASFKRKDQWLNQEQKPKIHQLWAHTSAPRHQPQAARFRDTFLSLYSFKLLPTPEEISVCIPF